MCLDHISRPNFLYATTVSSDMKLKMFVTSDTANDEHYVLTSKRVLRATDEAFMLNQTQTLMARYVFTTERTVFFFQLLSHKNWKKKVSEENQIHTENSW